MNRHSVSCPAPTPAWVSLVHSASVWASCLAWAPWASCAPRLSLTIVGPLVWHQEHCMHPTTVSHLGRKGAWIQLFKRRWCGKSGYIHFLENIFSVLFGALLLFVTWYSKSEIFLQSQYLTASLEVNTSPCVLLRTMMKSSGSTLVDFVFTIFYVEICTLPTLKTVLISPISWG